MIGTLFGSYRVVGVIGGGGMGTIYRAEHTLIGRPAAVKVLNPQFAQDRVVVNRFFNEARAATAIQHPGIVEVFDFGYQPDGSAFIVMEFLQGESLASRMHARGTLSRPRRSPSPAASRPRSAPPTPAASSTATSSPTTSTWCPSPRRSPASA
jgi:serine/threonine protein kinase